MKLSKKTIIFFVLLVVVGLIIYFVARREEELPYEYVIANRGNLVQEVSVTGRVKPTSKADLAFQISGRVGEINVKVGDKVFTGQVLMELENDDLVAQLLEAQANLEAQKAKLAELKKGTREEDIQISRTELDKAKQDLVHAYEGVADTLNSAYSQADNVVRKQLDDIFIDDDTTNPKLSFIVGDIAIDDKARNARFAATGAFASWRVEVQSVSVNSSPETLEQYLKNAKVYLITVRDLLLYSLDAVSNATDASLSSATAAAYKSSIDVARATINTAISNITAKEQSIETGKIAIASIQNQLNLKLAGATPEQIEAQEAVVKQAEAKVQGARAQLNKTIIRSPIKGVITKQEAKIGEIIPANAAAVSVIGEAKFEIEANVPEVDIAKISLEDSAKVTLDAYGNDVKFEAKVMSIDPAETIIEGVATYKVTLGFLNDDERIKSGMTANVDILTESRSDVVIIPQRAVIGTNGDKIVRVVRSGLIEEVGAQIGIRSSDGNVEVVSGVNEGDQVVTFLK